MLSRGKVREEKKEAAEHLARRHYMHSRVINFVTISPRWSRRSFDKLTSCVSSDGADNFTRRTSSLLFFWKGIRRISLPGAQAASHVLPRLEPCRGTDQVQGCPLLFQLDFPMVSRHLYWPPGSRIISVLLETSSQDSCAYVVYSRHISAVV